MSAGATAARGLASRAVADGRKNRAPLAVLARPRRSGLVAASAHEGAASRATPPTGRIPPDRRDISLGAVFRAIETARLYGSLRETSCRRPATHR